MPPAFPRSGVGLALAWERGRGGAQGFGVQAGDPAGQAGARAGSAAGQGARVFLAAGSGPENGQEQRR
jgi:hypothetical protein